MNKAIFGTTPREFIDKRICFEGERSSECDEKRYYMWFTSAPDELYPLSSKLTRAHTLVGMHRIGKLEGGGSYLHVITQVDLKLAPFA